MSKKRVVIIGAGISGLATAFRIQQQSDCEVLVLEKNEHAGGVARTDLVDGFVVERGPNGFLTNVPDMLDLCRDIGIGEQVVPAADAALHRYLYSGGALKPLPSSPGAFVGTDLLSWRAKLRVLAEPLVGRREAGRDESVFEFVARRLGPDFAEAFMSPMVLGVTAGDAKATSLDALFPRMRAIEDEHRSLFKGLAARQRQARRERAANRVSASERASGGRLSTVDGKGVGGVTGQLAEMLGDGLRLGACVSDLVQVGERYEVKTDGGDSIDADAVVLATPSHVAARVLRSLVPGAEPELGEIPYAGVRVLALGYRVSDVPQSLDGFGFLVPRNEGVRMLGCLWTSSIFPGHAPDGMALLRVMAGGVFDPRIVDASDDEALAVVRDELRITMGIEVEPTFVHHVVWPLGIPQYVTGHNARVERVMSAARMFPGIALTGNAYLGVSLNYCAADAVRVAGEVTSALSE